MLWKYFLFEMKLLLRNKFNWLLGLALVLFFPLYFIQYSDSDIESLQSFKNEESQIYHSIFTFFPDDLRETDKGEEVYNNLTEQSSMVNQQRYVLWSKGDTRDYITAGLRLNELRLRLYELGNEGLHPEFIIPKEEILKEYALLGYYEQHDLPIEADPLTASQYLPAAMEKVNGLLFALFVLFAASGMLVHDQQKRSVVGSFPVSFMNKVFVKTSIHFIPIVVFLTLGIAFGGISVARKTAWGNFNAPVLLFQQGDFTAISTTRYMLYLFIAMAVITLLLLLAFIVVNVLTENLYATVLIVVLVFLAPEFLNLVGLHAAWLQPLASLNIASVMNGDAALIYGSSFDYKRAMIWLIGLIAAMMAILYFGNKVTYRRKNAEPAYVVGKGGNN